VKIIVVVICGSGGGNNFTLPDVSEYFCFNAEITVGIYRFEYLL
jgi:hypothetical protein